MKQQLKPIIASLGLLGLVSVAAADTADSQQVEKLQQQVAQLQQDINTLKAQPKPVRHHAKKATASPAKPRPVQNSMLAAEVRADNSVRISGPSDFPQVGTSYFPIDIDVPGQSFVSTGPYLGVPLQYSGSNLIINNPTIYEDVSLLQLRQNVTKRLAELGVAHPGEHAHLLLSGMVQAQAYYKESGIAPSSSDINVTNVNLDGYVLGPSSWTSGLMSFAFENNVGANSGVVTSNHRVSNSRLFVNEAFVIIGDFNKSPVYGTAGQMYVPFGRYSSNFITAPVTKPMARTKARAILVGYRQQAVDSFYTAAYVFRGDSYVPSTYSKINNGGIDMGYRFSKGSVSGDIGAGVIANMADSLGMQKTDNHPLFDGFGSTLTSCGPGGASACGSESLVHRVPAYDVRGLVSIGSHVDLLAEYITASTDFNPTNLSYNSHGARPQALDAEAAYSFMAFNHPNSVAIGYGMTQEALAIGMPAKRYAVVMNSSIWRETLASLELRHDIAYSASATSSGAGVAGPSGAGRSDNVITAQFSIYF